MKWSSSRKKRIPRVCVRAPPIPTIHISGINSERIDSTESSFADDTRIFLRIKNETDTQMLQNYLHIRCTNWQIQTISS